jgi:hypothetical protein
MTVRWAGRRIAIVFAIMAALPSVALAQARGEKVYTIANYPIDATAENAVTAKERAMADGQQAAFRSLLKRLVPVTAYGRLKGLRDIKAGDMLEGFGIRSERNSTTQYIASLDFTFSAQAVRTLLRREGIPFVESQASQTVVVPLLRTVQGVEPATSADSRQWSDSWTGLDLAHALTPVRVGTPRTLPSGDAVKRLLAGDMGAIAALATQFRSDYTLVALAEPEPAAKRLHVWLAGSDASGPILLKRSYRLSGDTAYTMELAAVIGLGIMEGRWKARSGGGTVMPDSAEALELTVEFRSRAQWEEMRTRLERIPGVADVDVRALSTRNASLGLRYPGGILHLAPEVEAQGMIMTQGDAGWVLRPMP